MIPLRSANDGTCFCADSKNLWKSSQPFTAAEFPNMVTSGIEANPITVLDFDPVKFGDEFVPAAALELPEVSPGSFSLRGRGTRRYLTWLERPGVIELTVTGGLIAHYRDRDNVKLRLFFAQEATLEPVAEVKACLPDGQEYRVTLRSPHAGRHTTGVKIWGEHKLLNCRMFSRMLQLIAWRLVGVGGSPDPAETRDRRSPASRSLCKRSPTRAGSGDPPRAKIFTARVSRPRRNARPQVSRIAFPLQAARSGRGRETRRRAKMFTALVGIPWKCLTGAT